MSLGVGAAPLDPGTLQGQLWAVDPETENGGWVDIPAARFLTLPASVCCVGVW